MQGSSRCLEQLNSNMISAEHRGTCGSGSGTTNARGYSYLQGQQNVDRRRHKNHDEARESCGVVVVIEHQFLRRWRCRRGRWQSRVCRGWRRRWGREAFEARVRNITQGAATVTRRASVKSFVAVGQALVALVVGAACGGVITASAT